MDRWTVARVCALVTTMAALAACQSPGATELDAHVDAGVAGSDGGAVERVDDASTLDASTPDASTLDASTLDASDAGTVDAGTLDASPLDAAAPDAGTPRALRIAVISDLNGAYGSTTYEDNVHATVAALRDEVRPDLVLITGDMVAGQRAGLDYAAMWRGFHNAVTTSLLAAGIPIAPTPGNHDGSAYPGYEPEREEYARQWRDPARTPAVRFVDATDYPFRYSFELDGVFFLSLDATRIAPLDDAQRAWVRAQLEAARAFPVKIVFGHVPLHPIAIGRESEIMDDPELEALFAEHGVSLFVSGHHHAYYPGRAGGVRQLAMPCSGSGPRALVGTDAPSPRGLAVIDIVGDEVRSVEALRAPDFDATIARDGLPPFLYVRRGPMDEHLVVRDDLDPTTIELPGPDLGSPERPIVIDAFPYAVRGSTRSSMSYAFDAYACAPTINERGPEVVYTFTLDRPGLVTAWVDERSPVDVDVHLVSSLAAPSRVVSSCAARGNRHAAAMLPAGTHYVVVDTYGGSSAAGDYVLRADLVDDTWRTTPIAEGVEWRHRYGPDGTGQQQNLNVLEIDPSVPGVEIRTVMATGCQTIDELGDAVGAVAAINGGFFDGSCAPLSFARSGGVTIARNARTRATFGMTASREPRITRIAAGADWTDVVEGHGGGPLLVVAGASTTAMDWESEGFTGSFLGANPRTWGAIDRDGHVLLGTVDGRTTASSGMSLERLATWLRSDEIGAREALNLDGGGSTTFWVAGTGPTGVVNYPSDGAPRRVSGGLFVFAPALRTIAPHFATVPDADAEVGAIYATEVSAIDLEEGELAYTLVEAPRGMWIDPASGLVSWVPERAGTERVVVRVEDEDGGAREMAFEVRVR